MQTDTWLNDPAQPDCCPLCGQWLTGASNTCPACGFTAHEPAHSRASSLRSPGARQPNPRTPIPARASARRTQSLPGGSRRHAATQPVHDASPASARNRQHDSPDYQAESSLSMLSLLNAEAHKALPRITKRLPPQTGYLEHIDEFDTAPMPPSRVTRRLPRQTDRLEQANEIENMLAAPATNTVFPAKPPEVSPQPGFADFSRAVPNAARLALIPAETNTPVPFASIDEIDTLPERTNNSTVLQATQPTMREEVVDAASWTANPGSTSLAARLIASRAPRRPPRNFTLLDRARWWLLRPGNIEFLLWLGGSILLFSITFLLLLASALSLILPGKHASGILPNSTASAATTTLSPRLHLTLSGEDQARFLPGAELHLQGQGFHPHSQVVFLLDKRWPLLDQSGEAASIRADASGRFTVNLWLGQGTAWSTGSHQILAREVDSDHQASVPITITTPAQTSAPVPSNPISSTTPTPQISPTATAVPPKTTVTPTLTPGTTATPHITPTASPTKTVTPGPGTSTPTSHPTPTPGKTGDPAILSNSLRNNPGNASLTSLAYLNPLPWAIGFCYLLSMLLLGLAGVLRHRRQ